MPHADRAAGIGLCQALCARRGAGGLDHAGRRPRDAGLGVPQDRRRPADELPAGIGRRRRGARALFDHRARARPGLAHRRRAAPRSIARRAGTTAAFAPCNEPPLAALRALVAESRIELPDALPPMAAGIFGYLGYDMVRLMEELPAPNPDPIGIPDAILVRPTIVVRVRRGQGHDHRRHAGAAGEGVSAKTALARATERLAAIVDALDRPLDHAAANGERRPARRCCRPPTRRRPNTSGWCAPPRSTSPPATSFRWCCRSASRRRSNCRRSRSTARCGGSIRRRTSTSSTSATSRSPDRARKSW